MASFDRPSTPVPTTITLHDIVLNIAEFLPLPGDVLRFGLVSRTIYTLLLPKVYTTVDLKTSNQCRATLDMLVHRPDIVRCIRKLVLRPNHPSWAAFEEPLDEIWVVDKIWEMAHDLRRLDTFIWDGEESPPDSLWSVLLASCPTLDRIGTVVGSDCVHPESALFNFSGLRGFSLIAKKKNQNKRQFPLLCEELPDRLWRMLLVGSPKLEQLTIDSIDSTNRVFNIQPLIDAEWPQLCSLTLGDYVFHIMPVNSEFQRFLTSCRHLTRFSHNCSRRWSSFHSCSALPHLKFFSGIRSDLEDLPNPSLLKSVQLTTIPITPNAMVDQLARMLPQLTSLASLEINIRVTPTDVNLCSAFRHLLKSCPKLLHFQVLCSSDPSFSIMDDFSPALCESPHLQSFVLTKVAKPGEEWQVQTAAGIVAENPTLSHFSLRYTAEWNSTENISFKRVGTYEVVISNSGSPSSLVVYESGVDNAGMRVHHRYKYNLDTFEPITDHCSVSAQKFPDDILFCIADHIHHSKDLLHLSLTSSRLRLLLLPKLYERVHLKTYSQCRATLSMLARFPNIASHIRRLDIWINHPTLATPSEPIIDERWVTDMITRTAETLVGLEEFSWAGGQWGIESEMCRGLQYCCPRLRVILIKTFHRTPPSQLAIIAAKFIRGASSVPRSFICRRGRWGSTRRDRQPQLPKERLDLLSWRFTRLEDDGLHRRLFKRERVHL